MNSGVDRSRYDHAFLIVLIGWILTLACGFFFAGCATAIQSDDAEWIDGDAEFVDEDASPEDPWAYDSGRAELDSGVYPIDTGIRATDSGTATIDRPGTVDVPVDTGSARIDSGTTVIDSGMTVIDTGTLVIDTGFPVIDTGFPVIDTGVTVVDVPRPVPTLIRYELRVLESAGWSATEPYRLRDLWYREIVCDNTGSTTLQAVEDGWHRCEISYRLTPFQGTFYTPVHPDWGDHGNYPTVGPWPAPCTPTAGAEYRITDVGRGRLIYQGPASGLVCVLVDGRERHVLPP